MINIFINGCNGKMGQEVAKLVDKNKNMVLVGGFDKENTGLLTFPVFTDINNITVKPDVIIDFSIPKASLKILEYAKKENIPTVIATTGFSEKELNLIKDFSKDVPIFKSSNMSYDINLMARVLSMIAPILKDTDIEIIETHHNRKIDSPSRNSSTSCR